MSVKTQFSEADFKNILSSYNLGEYQHFNSIEKGTVQTNFLLQTDQGKFIFRYYENRYLKSVLFECELIKFLNDKNYPCPKVFANKEGKLVGEFNQKPFVIFEFIEGEHLENPSEFQKNQLIEKVAQLQNLTKDYHPVFVESRWNYNVELCKKLAQEAAERINTPDSKQKLKWFESELSRIDLPESLPKGICHCDFHFSNILFKDGEFKALIDFDDANYTYLTFDLATLINPFIHSFNWDSWPKFSENDNVFDFTESRKTVEEYMKYRSLSELEKKHFFDVFKLSIMLDCVWYFARGESTDFYEKRKIEYLNNLGRDKFCDQLFTGKSK